MAVWTYDGTFAGFLTLCAALISNDEEPEAIGAEGELQNDLFRQSVAVATDERRAEKMLEAIASRMSAESCGIIRRAFLSQVPGIELLLWRYISFGRTTGATVGRYLAHPAVAPVHRLARAVSREAHRLLGTVRFRETAGGYWYAPVDPAYHVLEIIAPHFADRCPDMKWLIHDRKRDLAAAWNGEEWLVCRFDAEGMPPLSGAEELWTELWKGYFTNLAIPERANPRLQRQHLPLRFRKYLTEISGV